MATGDNGLTEGIGHLNWIASNGNGGVYQHAVGSHLHSLGGMAWGTDTGIDNYGHRGLIDDYLQKVLHSQAFVSAYWSGQRHNGGCTGLFKVLTQSWVGLTIRQHHKTQLYKLLGSLECLYRIGQQIARIWMNLEFKPVGAKSLASHLGCKHSLFGIANARCVGQQLDVLVLGDVGKQVVVLVVKLHSLHGYGNHLGARGLDGLRHKCVVVELTCT